MGKDNTDNSLNPLKICQLFRDAYQKEHRIGLEVERLSRWADGRPFQYSSQNGQPGAETLLNQLSKTHGWEPIAGIQNRPIGLKAPGGKVSLEPGSQLEYSTDVAPSLVEVVKNIDAFEKQVSAITDPWGLQWITDGVHSHFKVEDMELIPSTRYQIMTDYLGKRGRLGTAMMRLTSSIQVNVDYTSEENAVEMYQCALAIVPLSYALFANSPYFHGVRTPFLSFRSQIWRETDTDRTGLVPEAFDPGFDLEKYTALLSKRPLMFALDVNGNYVETGGASLADISNGKLKDVVMDEANCWNAVREFFPEVRLKPGYIEVRAIDGLSREMRYAAAAFWMGILYSKDCHAFVKKTLGAISTTEREKLWIEACKTGPNTLFGLGELGSLAEEMMPMIEKTLVTREYGEEVYLEPLKDLIERASNPALEILSFTKGRSTLPLVASSICNSHD